MESAQSALAEVGHNHPILLGCQRELGHQLPLSSYLLKPMQRLTKYQLLLKDLSETFTTSANGQFELEESVEAMLEVIKAVNDSLHQINIKVGIKKIPIKSFYTNIHCIKGNISISDLDRKINTIYIKGFYMSLCHMWFVVS